MIGGRDLPNRLGMAFDLRQAVHRVDCRDDRSGAEVMAQHRVGLECREDRKRIRQAGTLDDQPAESRHFAALPPGEEITYGERQFAADGAANASRP